MKIFPSINKLNYYYVFIDLHICCYSVILCFSFPSFCLNPCKLLNPHKVKLNNIALLVLLALKSQFKKCLGQTHNINFKVGIGVV